MRSFTALVNADRTVNRIGLDTGKTTLEDINEALCLVAFKTAGGKDLLLFGKGQDLIKLGHSQGSPILP